MADDYEQVPVETRHAWRPRAILEWITTAKKAETRARRVTETAERAHDNVRADQWRQPRDRDGR